MESLIKNFYIIQLILQRGDVPKKKQEYFGIEFNRICLELQKNGIIINKIEIEKKFEENSTFAFLNNDTLIVRFRLLLEKNGKTIEPDSKLLDLPYEFLLQVLK